MMTREQAWDRFNEIDDRYGRSTNESRKEKWKIVEELRNGGQHDIANSIEWGIKNQ